MFCQIRAILFIIIAIIYASSTFATTSGTPETFFNSGVENIQEGNYEEAIRDFTKAIEIADDFYDAYYNRAIAKTNIGDVRGAKEDLQKIHKAQPKDMEVLKALGRVYEKLGKTDSAIVLYNNAIEENSADEGLYMERGLAFYTLGEHKKAVKDFDMVIDLNPNSAEAYMNRAGARFNLGEIEAAIEDYEMALKIKPDFEAAKQNLDLIRRQLEETSQKETEIDSAQYYLMQAGEAYNNRESAQAIRFATLAIEKDGKLREAYVLRGSAFLMQPTYSKAISDFNRAVKLGSENPFVYYGLGLSYYRLENYKAAIDAIDEAVKLDSDDPSLYMIRGQAASALIEDYNSEDRYFKAAMEDFDKIIEIDPKNAKAYHFRGNLYVRSNKVAEAIDDYKESVELDPNNPIYHGNLAAAMIGHYNDPTNDIPANEIISEAKRHARNAYDLSDGSMGLFQIAVSEAILGETDSAIEHIKILLDEKMATKQEIRDSKNFDNLKGNSEFDNLVD